MRLGFILDTSKSASGYRVELPMNALVDRGHVIVRSDDPYEDTPMAALFGCDLVHCFRRHDRIADLEELSRRGVAISFDNDDDFAASDMVGGKSSVDGRRINRQLAAAYEKAARLADLVTTPSPPLAEKYRAAGAQHVVVIDNYLDRECRTSGSALATTGSSSGGSQGLSTRLICHM